jgi:hypothetical protein
MTEHMEFLKNLKPLQRAQYYGLLEYIEREGEIFGTNESYQRMLKDLGLTPTQLKKAINWLVNENLIIVKGSMGVIKASLTDRAREWF